MEFSDQGPFDDEERAVIVDVLSALEGSAYAGREGLMDEVRRNARQLDRLGELLSAYPSLFAEQALGEKKRGLRSLVDRLSQSNLSNFEMFLPTRALTSHNLVMGETNFYRLLRFVCTEALGKDEAKLQERVARRLCVCLYTRLAEELLRHITSDSSVERMVRERAVLGLVDIWEQVCYRVSHFLPVLEATWEARRCVPVTLGTLLGTSELFALLREGCDERFVDHLVREERSANEEAAFREFLFGATTEQLKRIEQQMAEKGCAAIGADDVADCDRPSQIGRMGADPALAMFEFFLLRHLQAAARRLADLPGPKRTAEEYVLIDYLKNRPDPD